MDFKELKKVCGHYKKQYPKSSQYFCMHPEKSIQYTSCSEYECPIHNQKKQERYG